MPSFDRRAQIAEQMDAPDCDAEKLLRSYAQLALINKTIARTRPLLRRYVLEDAARVARSTSFLDVGCGGGDVLCWLARASVRAGIDIRLVGIDSDPRAVAFARRTLGPFPNASVIEASIADLERLHIRADYVFCSHVLHHVPDEELTSALRCLRRAANRRLIVSDLERSPVAYWLFTALAAVAFHRSFVYHDGRLSIRRGFRLPELEDACRQAGFPPATRVCRMPPSRALVIAPGMS
jgi:2-polyprenyl-3-methyl-5-hydroxy-6-metoxy-1,4-benzoquinol methylase